MQQEKATEILDVMDDVLKANGLTLVLPEDMKEYQETKEDGNGASIYGDIYFALEEALKEIPSKEDRYKDLLNKTIEGLGVGLNIPTLISDLLDIGFTPKELEEDFNFSKQDIQDVLYEMAEDAIEQ